LKKEHSDLLRKEVVYLAYVALAIALMLKVAFFRTEFPGIIKSAFSWMILFVIPGHCMMIYWSEKLDFFERMLVGTLIAAGTMGILSYYLALMGLNIKYHMFLLPILLSGAGLFFFFRKNT
jgi:hypothetical protein